MTFALARRPQPGGRGPHPGRHRPRWAAWRRGLLLLAGGVAVVLAVLVFAVHDAKARILQALGPRASVGAISLSYPQVTLHDVRIAADATPGAWPADEEFHAALVAVRIDVASLWGYRHGQPLVVSDVRVEDGNLVLLRTPGHLVLLPALRETTRTQARMAPPGGNVTAAGDVPTPKPAVPGRALILRHAHVERMSLDLFDATLPGGGPRHLRFEQVQGDVGDIALPTLDTPISLAVRGLLKGVERDGQISASGRFTPAAHEGNLALRGGDIDMIVLEPYLLRLGEGSVRHGRLDLELDAHVARSALTAPGHLTLTGLEFADGGGTFAGVSRRAVLAALSRNGQIEMRFTLVGRTDDPKFSLNESLATRIASGMAQAVGVSVRGVVDGLGEALKGLLGGNR